MIFILNFGILAHIDHGKTTLTDLLLEYTNTISRKKIEINRRGIHYVN
nr:GTP-binding protein [Candidatus Karelsulcia muelleri]